MTLESSAPLSLDTVTQEARSEWAMWPLPNYCWAMRLVYLVVIRLVLLPAKKRLGTAVLPDGTLLPGRDLCAPGLKSHVQGFCLKGLAVLTLLAGQQPAFFSSQYPSAACRVAQAGVVPSFSRLGNGVLVTTEREITVGFSLSRQKAPSRVIDS